MRATGAVAQDRPPLVVVEKQKGAMRIVALSRAAKRAGLVSGLTLADARARIPDLWVEEADNVADAALLDAIADDCDRISPIIMIDPPDGLLIDITGSDHLFGGEAAMGRDVSRRLRRAGLHARTVIAGAPETARAIARFGGRAIVAAGEETEAVRRLPVASLSLPDEHCTVILRAGLKTVGALMDRPGQLFAARFGEEIMLRLDRLRGAAPAPLTPRRVIPMAWAERRFAEPIARTEDIEAMLAELAREVCILLAERREGGRVFEASFYRSDGAVRRIVVQTGRSLRDCGVVLRLFREKLDSLVDPIDPGFGFDHMRFAIPLAEALDAVQSGLDGRTIADDEVGDLADRLSTRFGAMRVLRFLAQDTHDPERAVCLAPASFNPMTSLSWPETEEGEPPFRPAHIFDPPQPIEIRFAEVPDGPPRRFFWRRKEFDVLRAEGPERIAPEWWREEVAGSRDYYRIEDATGRRFWLFRAGDYGGDVQPVWYVHGIFA